MRARTCVPSKTDNVYTVPKLHNIRVTTYERALFKSFVKSKEARPTYQVQHSADVVTVHDRALGLNHCGKLAPVVACIHCVSDLLHLHHD